MRTWEAHLQPDTFFPPQAHRIKQEGAGRMTTCTGCQLQAQVLVFQPVLVLGRPQLAALHVRTHLGILIQCDAVL